MLRYMIFQLDQFAVRRPRERRCCGSMANCPAFCKHCPTWSYLTVSYLLSKVLYIVNVIAQLYALERFLGMRDSYNMFGIRTASRLLNGERWLNSSSFPLVCIHVTVTVTVTDYIHTSMTSIQTSMTSYTFQ